MTQYTQAQLSEQEGIENAVTELLLRQAREVVADAATRDRPTMVCVGFDEIGGQVNGRRLYSPRLVVIERADEDETQANILSGTSMMAYCYLHGDLSDDELWDMLGETVGDAIENVTDDLVNERDAAEEAKRWADECHARAVARHQQRVEAM